jgi:transposase
MTIRQREEKSRSHRRRRLGTKVEPLTTIEPNAAGIDVGASSHFVAVPAGRDPEPVREFSAFTSGLHDLADWLQTCGVTTVAMESTGVYWISLYDLLQERGIEVFLVNAQHVRGVPGRKSDVLDCQWLQQLHSYGLLKRSFRPDADFVKLRTYLRHRGSLIDARSSLILQIQKTLTLCNVQLHLVVTDISGETGMKIIRDILAGNHSPESLARHRHYHCKASTEQIAEALRGEYREEHLFLLRQLVTLYDAYGERLVECDQLLAKLLYEVTDAHCAELRPPTVASSGKSQSKRRPKGAQFEIRQPLQQLVGVDLTAIPGLGELSALQLIGEIGIDMARWPDADHFTSWTTLAPSCRITGGKAKNSHRPQSAHRVADILRMVAMNAGRTLSALGGFYRRLAARIGKAKAVVATAAKIARIVYLMIRNGTPYEESGCAAYEQRYRDRVVRNLQQRAKAFGFSLVPGNSSTETSATGGAVC